MTDLSKLSDDELLAMHAAATAAPQGGTDLSKLSDDELLEMHAKAVGEHVPEKVAENPHEIVPFLKNTAKGLWEGAKSGAAAVGNAAMHPVDTTAALGEWMLMGGGPGGDSDQALVSGRTLRHVPLAGSAYDNVRGLADPGYQEKTAVEDAQFSKAHPTLAKAQDLVGQSAGTVAGGLGGAGLYVADAYHRSRMAGNDSETAMQDARNVGLLIGGGEVAGKAIGKVSDTVAETGAGDAVKGLAEEKAFKAAVGNQAKAYNEASARGVINERGRELLDSGTVGFGDSAQQIADKAGIQKAAAGKAMGDQLAGLDEVTAPSPSKWWRPKGAVSGQSMADNIRGYASDISGSGNQPMIKALNEAADTLETEGYMPFSRAQTHKDSWKWSPSSSVTAEVARKVKGIIGDEMESAVERAGNASEAQSLAKAAPAEVQGMKTGTGPDVFGGEHDPITAAVGEAGADLQPHEQEALASSMRSELGGAEVSAAPAEGQITEGERQRQIYEDLKSKYGTNAAAQKDGQVNANRYAKNNSASLGDKAAFAAGAVLSPHTTAWKVATGVAMGVLNKTIRKRGASAAAVGLDKIGDLLNSNPEAFGRFAAPLQAAASRGPQALAVAHYMMSQQDPEYSKMMGSKP